MLDPPGFAGQDPTRFCQVIYDPLYDPHGKSHGNSFTILRLEITGMFRRIAVGLFLWNLFLWVCWRDYHLILAGAWLFILALIDYDVIPTRRQAKHYAPPDLED